MDDHVYNFCGSLTLFLAALGFIGRDLGRKDGLYKGWCGCSSIVWIGNYGFLPEEKQEREKAMAKPENRAAARGEGMGVLNVVCRACVFVNRVIYMTALPVSWESMYDAVLSTS